MKPLAAIPEHFYGALRDVCFRNIARLLVVSHLLFSIRPAMPVILDNLAHRYQPEHHFRTVHAHGGNEHVHFEVQKAMKEDAQEEKDHRIKIVFDDLVCLNDQSKTPPHFIEVAALNRYSTVRSLFPLFERVPDYPPPRV